MKQNISIALTGAIIAICLLACRRESEIEIIPKDVLSPNVKGKFPVNSANETKADTLRRRFPPVYDNEGRAWE